MRILAVDTSGKEIGIGVFEGKKCLYEEYIRAERLYNKHIMPMVAEALLKSGTGIETIDVFAAVLGPGSFTGIRVGMAVMKAFAHGLNKSFCGVPALDVLAEAAAARGRKWAVLEAGRTEVFAAEYEKSGLPAVAIAKAGVRGPSAFGKPSADRGSGIKRKYLLLARDKFFKKIKAGDTVAGMKGENIMVELKEKSSKINIVELEHVYMKSFAALISPGKKSGKNAIYETAPVYIRLSEAEARRGKMKVKSGGKVK